VIRHVIVGAGPAGIIAAETLRKVDPQSRVTLVGDEPEPPYSRMAIPYLLEDQIDERGTHLRRGEDHYERLGIEVVRDRVRSLDLDGPRATLESGGSLDFDRLLVATGSRPVPPPIPGVELDGVHPCWTLEDARRIAARAGEGSRVVLIGAGFIGCILLESLASRGVDLTVVEMRDRMVPRMLNDTAAGMLRAWCETKGVRVLTSTRVEAIEADGGDPVLGVRLAGGTVLPAHLVVTATGVRPNLALLEGSGIDTDQGVLVDEHLRSSHPSVFAAGDVAQGRDFSTGGFSVHAIQPTAADHGRIAALNMAGRETRYVGSVNMNVLDTLGLVSTSFGLWSGAEGGDAAEVANPDQFEYLNLQFEGDVLVGASSLGLTEHVGVLRGLIQSRVRLGPWKEKLRREPKRFMEAYLARTQPLGLPASVLS